MQILLSIPTHDNIKRETVGSLFAAVSFLNQGISYKLNLPAGCFIHQNRNNAVLEAIKHEVNYIMFIDSDMVFPKEAIAMLISRDKDIIAGKANKRKLPPENNIKLLNPQNDYYTPAEEELSKEPFLVRGAIGCAFMLIKTSVFHKLNRPWFSYSHLDSIDNFSGEDVYFCRSAQEAGIEVWCDPTITIGHVGEYVY